MIQNKKGFTLVELMAVIVILAIIITVASSSIFATVNRAKKGTAEEMRGSLSDIAITYVLDNYHLKKCSDSFSKEMIQGKTTNLATNGNCAKKITVDTLIKEGLFEDKKGYCKKTDFVIVYRYSNGDDSEYKAYASDTVCTNF